jgi:lysozyme family protein
MDANFDECFIETESWEGFHQYSDNPHDPGGATYSGVTQRAYDGYRLSKKLSIQNVRRMTDDECREIYQLDYWIPAHGPDLPVGLDLCQYDEAVNSGPVEATKLLQASLGIAIDGAFGLETLGAVQRYQNVPALIKKVCAARLSFWHKLKTWIYFGVGWNRRDVGIEDKALALYAASQKLAQG